VDPPAPDSAIDALRRDVLGGLVALEERVRHHLAEELAQTRRYIDERVGESTAETRRYVDEQTTGTRRYIDERLTGSTRETHHYIDQGLAGSTAETHRYIDELLTASTAETRRHFGIVAESLMTKMELLAEGVRVNGERLERFQGEVHEQFARVDRRLLRLEARLTRKRRR
jgi:hypothetical protein